MAQIQDFVREGGWPVLDSTSKLLLVNDTIVVTPARGGTPVEIRRDGRTVALGQGSLVQPSLMVDFGFAMMQLTRMGTKLDFKVLPHGSGPSPGGGGTSGGPEG